MPAARRRTEGFYRGVQFQFKLIYEQGDEAGKKP